MKLFMLSLILSCCCNIQSGIAFSLGSYKNNNYPLRQFIPSTTITPKIVGHRYTHYYSVPPTQEETATTTTASSTTTTATAATDEVTKLRRQAEQIRLEAQKLDLELTTQKIDTIEQRLNNESWLAKHPEEAANLKSQLKLLNDRLVGNTNDSGGNGGTKTTTSSSSSSTSSSSSSSRFFPSTLTTTSQVEKDEELTTTITKNDLGPSTTTTTTKTTTSSLTGDDNNKKSKLFKSNKKKEFPQNPISGFDESDLVLYLPVAKEIDVRLSNATLNEKLEAFRSAPELQEHFKQKVQALLMEPLEQVQKLETLKKDYLQSTSSKEKEALKRQIDKMEEKLEREGPYFYSDSVYCFDLPELTEEEIQTRLEAVGALPETLQALYKQRCGVEHQADLRTTIQIDHYEPQLQLMEQIRFVNPLPDEMRAEFIQAFDSLPPGVQDHFIKLQGMNKDEVRTAEDAIKTMEGDMSSMSPLMQVMAQANANDEFPEYDDIEYLDRSRFLEEFFPNVASMEGSHPKLEDVEQFASEVVDKKVFMVTSKPERVVGGYYIRGRNLLEGDDASDKLVQRIKDKLEASPLSSKLEFFYILDPSPPTDEDIELESTINPLILVISKDRELLLNPASGLTKAGVSSLAVFSALLFSTGSCALNPVLADRFTASLDAASAGGTLDLQWLADLSIPIFLSILGVQVAHEMAHRVIGWKDKFDVGLPTLLPSLSFGMMGAITPLRSPPPNYKSLFDFSIAGPLVGLVLSTFLLASGLSMTASMDSSIALPVVPVDLLRASSFIGGMTSFFLGNGALMPNQGIEAVVELHPLAVAGVVGCLANALALLPLGHTDGGRISLTMFGRRGAFIVKLFTTLLLLAGGVFGLDNVNIFLTYVLFASIWQRELDLPVQNEVDELDFPRGLLGITSALLVALVLVPML